MSTPESIAVVGAGSSGLISLKYLKDQFPESTITCFEQGDSVRGSWGNQRDSFISTSTIYTTQFSCFRITDASLCKDHDYGEYFKGREYGDYLEEFAMHFHLYDHIRFGTQCTSLKYAEQKWELILETNSDSYTVRVDAVFLCTGLVHTHNPLPFDQTEAVIPEDIESVKNTSVVIIGGGESASDLAHVLAEEARGNTVYLSLRSGIRVSPRYHPIRGVPSDFLRNRLLLSVGKGIRNWVGERFVGLRIRYEEVFSFLFPAIKQRDNKQSEWRRKYWDLQLKSAARHSLFNVFHNKSDDFLIDVDEGRLQIVGPPLDDSYRTFFSFDRDKQLDIYPDYIIPTTGYRSILPELSSNTISLEDFYHCCIHAKTSSLFLIGFARPIIGNIPSISEIQARYATGILSEKYSPPAEVHELARKEHQQRILEYPTLPTEVLYPVEYIHYCDMLALEMSLYPSYKRVKSIRLWLAITMTPASTQHYVDDFFDPRSIRDTPVYSPFLILCLLSIIRILELIWNRIFPTKDKVINIRLEY